MTAVAAIRQSDIERAMRAATATGCPIEIDIRRGVIRAFPANHRSIEPKEQSTVQTSGELAPDGQEDFS